MSTESPRKQEEQEENKKKKRWLLLLLILLLLLLGVGCMEKQALGGKSSTETAASSSFFDPAAQNGNLPGKTPEEIQAELDKIVEEGMFNISIASIVVVDADGNADVRIENIAANHHNMTVSITLDDDAVPIYESAGLAPGQYIETVQFDRTLPAGEYSATALFTAYDLETLEPQGQAAAKISILVRS